MYHELETDRQDAHEPSDGESKRSSPAEQESQRLVGGAASEYLRMGTGMTALTVHQFQHLLRSQARGAVLLQRLLATSTRTMFAAPMVRSRAQAAEPETVARSRAQAAEPETAATDARRSEDDAVGAETADEPDGAKTARAPEQAADANDQRATLAVRRTPSGEPVFKQWQPQQLSVEPPEHDRLAGEKRREQVQKAESGRSQERGRSGTEEEQIDEPDPAEDML
jgi:hypothetical protein